MFAFEETLMKVSTLTCTLETTLRTFVQVFHAFTREWAWIEKVLTLSSLSAFKSDQAATKRICDFTDVVDCWIKDLFGAEAYENAPYLRNPPLRRSSELHSPHQENLEKT
jgi:hypothetical protein